MRLQHFAGIGLKQHKITLKGSGKTFLAGEDESVLTAAIRQGVMLPYSCKNGTCASCKGQLIEGDIDYPFHPPMGLDEGEAESGAALFCQAVAKTDLQIAVREIEAVRDIPVRMMPARVIYKEFVSPTVVRLFLRLPKAQRLQFLAGQYLDILLPGGKRRSFSIASAPQNQEAIELHIRHVDGGGFTSFVFDELQEKGILRIEGPLGTFFIRNDQPERPVIMMGGGTGFAPLKSMLEYMLGKNNTRNVHLYWGVADQAELYLDELPAGWSEKYPHITYTPVLSHALAEDNWKGRDGFVHEAVLQDYPDLSGHDLYMSGPPVMIDAARHAFLEAGIPERRLYYDSFEFAPDVPVSVLAEPH